MGISARIEGEGKDRKLIIEADLGTPKLSGSEKNINLASVTERDTGVKVEALDGKMKELVIQVNAYYKASETDKAKARDLE